MPWSGIRDEFGLKPGNKRAPSSLSTFQTKHDQLSRSNNDHLGSMLVLVDQYAFQPLCFFLIGFFANEHQEAMLMVSPLIGDRPQFIWCHSEITLRASDWLFRTHIHLPFSIYCESSSPWMYFCQAG
jgi:hypothetical protein